MILPYFNYSNFLFHSCSLKTKTKIQRLQNRGLRVCLRAHPRENVASFHERTNLSTLENRRKTDILKYMFHLIHTNPSLQLIPTDGIGASTRARTGILFNIDIPRSSKARNSLMYHGVHLWNNLPPDLRNITDFVVFKYTV